MKVLVLRSGMAWRLIWDRVTTFHWASSEPQLQSKLLRGGYIGFRV